MRQLVFLHIFLTAYFFAIFLVEADAAAPTITTFTAVSSGNNADIDWTVEDADGDLSMVEIWRARSDIGAPRDWGSAQVHASEISGSGDTGSYLDGPGDGIWWYGLRVTDIAGNSTDAIYAPDAQKVDLEFNTCTDADGDYYFSESSGCSNRFGFKGHDDCDDTLVFVNGGRDEICGNSIDDDCDGETDEAGCVNKTIYYVKNDGNDGNSGLTDALAWQTLAKVETAVSANNMVLLKGGDSWHEEFEIPVSGLEINWYGSGAKPIITGSAVISGSWTLDSGNIYKLPHTGGIDNLLHNGGWMHISHEPDGTNNRFVRNDPATEFFQILETGDDMTWGEAVLTSGQLVAETYEWRRDVYDIQSYTGGVIQLVEDRATNARNKFNNNGIYPQPDWYWLIDSKSYLDTDTEWWADSSYVYTYSAGTPTGTWEAVTGEYGIYAEDKDDITIANIHIKNVVNGVYLEDCLRFTLNSLEISYVGTQRYRYGVANMDVSHGVMIEGDEGRSGEEGLIEYCSIHHIMANGIDVLDYGHLTVDHCLFEEIATVDTTESFETYSGFSFAVNIVDFSGYGTRSNNATVSNCYFENLGGGGAIMVAYGLFDHNTVIHPTLHLADIGAFYRSGTNNNSHDTVVSDNGCKPILSHIEFYRPIAQF